MKEKIKVAFQGEKGAYSHLASLEIFPNSEIKTCATFEETFQLAKENPEYKIVIPIENSLAGRVADIHHLLPNSELHIIGEHFQRVEHHLLVVKGTALKELTYVHSHVHALNQCRKAIQEYGLEPMVHVDTAAAAREIAEHGEMSHAAIASKLAGEIYGLDSLRANIEDADHNTTRFLLMARAPLLLASDDNLITSFVFRVRNVSAALYKALGGFATNGVNMLKLESYLVGGGFVAAQFYAEIEGHPENDGVRLALEELSFFTHEVRFLGTYPRNPARDIINKNGAN